jgi:hypothetical protein
MGQMTTDKIASLLQPPLLAQHSASPLSLTSKPWAVLIYFIAFRQWLCLGLECAQQRGGAREVAGHVLGARVELRLG